MKVVTLSSKQLAGKIIDVHTHVGIGATSYVAGSYPYCQSVESLLCRLNMYGIDCAVTFPFGEALMNDVCQSLSQDKRIDSHSTPSGAPYAVENRLLCDEVYAKAPGAAGRILPFLNADPGRHIRKQLKEMQAISEEFPIYGIKIAGVAVHSSHKHLMDKAEGIVRFAEERNIPILLHSTAYKDDRFCFNGINLAVAKKFPKVRFCLAHCLGFDREHLKQADKLANVWVDSAAMKIQVEAEDIMAPPERRYKSDYTDHTKVFADLAKSFPKTMLWGSDSPAYSYITKRRYPDGSIVDFKLEGTYAMEAAVIDALPESKRYQIASKNTRHFLFG
jgi:predicted TIM-barrel fold metal-dependent hydrolase